MSHPGPASGGARQERKKKTKRLTRGRSARSPPHASRISLLPPPLLALPALCPQSSPSSPPRELHPLPQAATCHEPHPLTTVPPATCPGPPSLTECKYSADLPPSTSSFRVISPPTPRVAGVQVLESLQASMSRPVHRWLRYVLHISFTCMQPRQCPYSAPSQISPPPHL